MIITQITHSPATEELKQAINFYYKVPSDINQYNILQSLYAFLRSFRSENMHNEKQLQLDMEKLFIDNGIPFNREKRLDEKNIPDFFIYGTAIEVKIKGKKKSNLQATG
jgi:hypothetical protein